MRTSGPQWPATPRSSVYSARWAASPVARCTSASRRRSPDSVSRPTTSSAKGGGRATAQLPFRRRRSRRFSSRVAPPTRTIFGCGSYGRASREAKCEICGLAEWMNRPAPLQLDHINGDRCDNRLENLRIVCPNCHAQTDTWCGENQGRVVELAYTHRSNRCAERIEGSNPSTPTEQLNLWTPS